MASKYSVETVFKLIDEVTKPLDKINGSATRTADLLKNSYVAAEKRVDSFGGKLKKMMEYAPLALAGAGTAAAMAATRQFIEFDDAVTKSGALFTDTQNLKGDAFKSALKDIGAEARKVAAATEFNAVDTAGAMQKMAMAGMSAKTSMELLRGTTDLATAAGTDLTTAVDIATDALGAFGMEATAGNLQRISDVMAKTASAFNTDLQPMFEAIKNSGPTFTTAGQSIDVLSASIGVLANAGIKGSGAGTALNAVFTQLSNEVKQNALGKLGIQTKDAAGNFINLFDIVGQLQNKLEGMGNAQQSAVLTEIFDTRGAKAMNLLLGAGVDELKKHEAALKNSAGAAADMADIMRGSLKNQIEVLKSELMELGFKFVEAFEDKGASAITKLTNYIHSLDVSSLAEKISAAIGTVMNFMGVLWRLRGVLIGVWAATLAYKTVMTAFVVYSRAAAVLTGILAGAQMAYKSIVLGSAAATSAMALAQGAASKSAVFFSGVLTVQNKLLGKFRDITAQATVAQIAMTAAQWLLNGAVAACPIVLIIMGIIAAVAALVALIVLVVKNWDKITAAITRAAVWLKAFFSSLGTNITKALEPAINRLKDAWTTVTSAFSKAWNAALSLFKDIWNSASTFFSSIWEGMIRVMSKAGNWFGGVWQTVTNAFSRAWTRVSEIFVSIWEGIKGIIIKFIDWLWPVIDKIIAPFKAVGKAIGSIINTVGGWFSDAANAGNTALDAYDKANAKTSGAATVIEEAEPPVSLGYIPFDASKFGVDPALYADGVTGGKSKLHGVVDISGGASIPGLTGTPTGTATGGAAGSSISESAALASILSVIRHIDGSVAEIVRMPRLRTASSDAGSYDAGSGDINPRNTAPVTQAERIAYSMQERRETVVIEVAAAQGTEARIVRSPKNVNIRLVHSGANYE